MTKVVNKKIIKDAILAELNKEPIKEGPFDAKVFDLPARAAAGVGNMFANIGGQMKLGAINKELDRTAQRIEVDWKKAEDVATKLANKMQVSKNPNIQSGGASALKNIQSAGSDIKNATNKLRSISKSGADKALPGTEANGVDQEFQNREKTDEYGLKYIETPVERWVNSFGGNYEDLGRVERNHMNRLFMELRSAGINPFKVPKDKQALLAHYSMHRNSQIAATGVDPYPDFNHFEMVLGKKVADELRKKEKEGMLGDDQQDLATPPAEQPEKKEDDVSHITPALVDYVAKARNFAKSKGVSSNMMDQWLAKNLEKIKNVEGLTDNDKQFINKLILKGGGQPTNAFGGGNFSPNVSVSQPNKNAPPPAATSPSPNQGNNQIAPVPLVQKKGQLPAPPLPPKQQAQQTNINQMKPANAQTQQAVKSAPIKPVGEVPGVASPKQRVGSPINLPSVSDFFNVQSSPMDPKSLPVPPSEKEQDLMNLSKNPEKWKEFKKKYPKSSKEEEQMNLSNSLPLPEPPPIKDNGNEVQVGDVENPAFKPSPPKSKKKVSAKRKK